METVEHVIVHKLVKEKHGKATVIERTEALEVTEPVKKLILGIHELYAKKTGKGYGRFEPDKMNYPSSTILRDVFISESTSFVDGSKQLMTVLSTKAGSVPLATGGYVLMAQVTNEAHVSWFLVAIINNVTGSVINDQTLEVIDSTHVDLTNLRVAGRVNLTDWKKTDEDIRYISFIKQRGEVADYFKDFLGCNELIKDTEETKKLVDVLKKFAKRQGLDQVAEDEFFNSASAYCKKCNTDNEPLSLEALANTVWPNNPKMLQDVFVEDGVQISDGFVPDGRVIKGLVNFHYKTINWELKMSRRALSEGYAHYDQRTETLILQKLPTALKAELAHEIADGN